VHAALIFEHVGLGRALANAISLVTPGGQLSVVLQLPGKEDGVTATRYASMQALKHHFALVGPGKLQRLLGQKGFRLIEQQDRSLPSGKGLWLGVFAQNGDA
jgi:threonine dehydrogenase-like Zn-dependent dehydrogenase